MTDAERRALDRLLHLMAGHMLREGFPSVAEALLRDAALITREAEREAVEQCK